MDFEALYPDTCTSVSLAARDGNYEALKVLLERGKSANIQDNRGWRALHHAADGGHLKCIQLLLKAPEVDVNAMTFMRETALQLVCDSNMNPAQCFLIAKLLLENGADPNIDKQNRYRTVLNSAIAKNNLELVKLLLEYKADVNVLDDAYGSALDVAVKCQSHQAEIVQLILQQKLDLNPRNSKNYHYSFFYRLLSSKNITLLRTCLKNPQCCRLINFKFGPLENTPLMFACKFPQCFEGIDLLLDYGADANIRDVHTDLPFQTFAMAYTYDKDHCEENVCRIFLRLFHATNISELKAKDHKHPSIFHSLLRQNDSCSKKMLLELINEQNYIKPNNYIVDTDIRSSNWFTRCFHLYSDWIISKTVSPLALFFKMNHWDFDILNSLLQDVIDLNDLSMNRIPPLVAAVACCLWNQNREKFVHRLLERGANSCIKINAEDILPTAFLFAITHSHKGPLKFLLVHSVPAQVVFLRSCFYQLSTMYLNIMKLDSYNRGQCDHRPACYTYLADCLISIIQWLACVNKFIPILPQTALELVDIFRYFVDLKYLNTQKENLIMASSMRMDTYDMEEEIRANTKSFNCGRVRWLNQRIMNMDTLAPEESCDCSDEDEKETNINKMNFIQTYQNCVFDLQNLIGTIKPLRRLCILKIRFELWNNRRSALICDSVRTFAREANLPPPIESLLLLGAEKDSCCS